MKRLKNHIVWSIEVMAGWLFVVVFPAGSSAPFFSPSFSMVIPRSSQWPWVRSFEAHRASQDLYDILIGGLEHFYDFPYVAWYVGNNHPNWRTHIFQRGRSTTNQHQIEWRSPTRQISVTQQQRSSRTETIYPEALKGVTLFVQERSFPSPHVFVLMAIARRLPPWCNHVSLLLVIKLSYLYNFDSQHKLSTSLTCIFLHGDDAPS